MSRRLSAAFAVASFALLAQVGLAHLNEENRPWRNYQRAFIESGAAQKAGEGSALPASSALPAPDSGQPRVVEITLPDGKVERCLTCHLGIEEISPSHPVESVGCASCHGGNPLSLDATQAHRLLQGGRNPSDLRVAAATCGGTGPGGVGCHEGNSDPEKNHVSRVKSSLMATKAGEIAQVRYSFGIQKDLERAFLPDISPNTIEAPLNGRPQEAKFKENCTSRCHLWAGNSGDPDRTYSGGCASCHYLYGPSNTYEGNDVTIPKGERGRGVTHRLTTQIPYTQCNRCHNQGTHSLAKMEFNYRDDLTPKALAGLTAAERREKEYYIPLELYALCEVTLDCIDCHNGKETMGRTLPDGKLPRTMAEAQTIRCLDCHGTTTSAPASVRITDPNDSVLADQRFRDGDYPELQVGDAVGLATTGDKLPYLRFIDGKPVLFSKVTAKAFDVPLAKGTRCEQIPENQDAQSCHTCHNQNKSQ